MFDVSDYLWLSSCWAKVPSTQQRPSPTTRIMRGRSRKIWKINTQWAQLQVLDQSWQERAFQRRLSIMCIQISWKEISNFCLDLSQMIFIWWTKWLWTAVSLILWGFFCLMRTMRMNRSVWWVHFIKKTMKKSLLRQYLSGFWAIWVKANQVSWPWDLWQNIGNWQ